MPSNFSNVITGKPLREAFDITRLKATLDKVRAMAADVECSCDCYDETDDDGQYIDHGDEHNYSCNVCLPCRIVEAIDNAK